MTDDRLPLYEDLPLLNGTRNGERHSRGLLPEGRATLSFIQPERVARAAAAVTEGRPVSLNLPLDAFDPPLFGRSPLTHAAVEVTRNESEDVISDFNPQASSQLDGLAHVRAGKAGYYDGSTSLDSARVALGLDHWAATGIAARGILLDLPRYFAATGQEWDPFDGRPVSANELTAVADHEGVTIEPGDVLLVRTRWAADYLAAPQSMRDAFVHWNGLSAAPETAAFLWDKRIALVGTDNPAVEDAPGSPERGSLHRRMLPALGLSFLELLDLEVLATECARLDRWHFLFTSAPLNLRGAVSSPANALALL